jgi:hypothetical protein
MAFHKVDAASVRIHTQAKNAFYDSQAELRQSTFKAHARRELQRQVQLLTWLSTPQHEFAPEERLDSQVGPDTGLVVCICGQRT